MCSSYLCVFVPIVALVINVLIQILCFRIFPQFGLLRSVFLGFIIGFISLFFVEFHILSIQSTLAEEIISTFVVQLITYVSLCYCYFHFVNLGETARRIRILRELKDSNNGLDSDEILKRYNAKEIIQNRLTRLISSGQIILKDNRYFIRLEFCNYLLKSGYTNPISTMQMV